MTGLVRPTLLAVAGYFLRLGATGFGGPIALVGAMERDLVAERHWFTPDEFARSLAFSQMAPGPLAAQVAICLGYLHSRIRGATLAAVAFILPAFMLTLGIGALYLRFGGMPALQEAFYGVGAAVVGIIAWSAFRLAQTATAPQGNRAVLLVVVAISVALVTVWRAAELPAVFLAAGAVAAFGKNSIRWLAGAPGYARGVALVPQLLWFFFKAGAFVFGSGLAIVPFLHQGAVVERGWLTERQFVDAIAVAMLTPGPVVITAAFIGFLLAGVAGAGAASLGVFLPAWLLVLTAFPLLERHRARPAVRDFVQGVTAAAAGALLGATILLGRRAIMDLPTAGIALLALAVTIRFKAPTGLVVLGGAAIGWLARQGM